MFKFQETKDDIEINERKYQCSISIQWEGEQDAPDFDLGTPEENEREMRRFDSGELLNISIRVTAHAFDESGTDSLGQCFIRATKFNEDLSEIISTHDMIANAKSELVKSITEKYKLLKPLFEVIK